MSFTNDIKVLVSFEMMRYLAYWEMFQDFESNNFLFGFLVFIRFCTYLPFYLFIDALPPRILEIRPLVYICFLISLLFDVFFLAFIDSEFSLKDQKYFGKRWNPQSRYFIGTMNLCFWIVSYICLTQPRAVFITSRMRFSLPFEMRNKFGILSRMKLRDICI